MGPSDIASRALRRIQELVTLAESSREELLQRFLAAGCEVLDCNFGAYTQRQDHTLSYFGYDRSSGRTQLQDHRSAEVILTESAVWEEGRYIGAPVGMELPVLGSLSFWPSDGATIPTDADAIASIRLIACLLAGRLSHQHLSSQLAYQARHDALTGLANRLLQKERLELALDQARCDKTSVAIVFIDLDRFKQVNDTLGHKTGDALLQQIAHRLRSSIDPKFTLARMGGDEFTAILTGLTDEFHAIGIVNELLDAVRKPLRIYDFEMFVTASMGVSFFPKDGKDAMTLVQNADAAMYMAKRQGRDGFCVFSTSRTEEALEHFEMENYLRRAVENNELELLYQPQVDRESRLIGFEVLTVWNHPKLGRISPAQFIPIAEISGMITAIGSAILENAMRQAVAWNDAGYRHVRLSVNVSPLQLEQGDFVPKVSALLNRYRLPPDQLDLEITESVVMKDVEQASITLRSLRNLGVRITIDDFGTGYSSLSYLHRIPANALKIDRSFFSEKRLGRVEMIRAMVAMAHSLGLKVTAEGIEEWEQAKLALDSGCDEMQGHRFGVPLRRDAAERYLKRMATSA